MLIFTQSESQVSNYFRYLVMAENCNITSVAWDLLTERYDNRKLIRESHVKALLNLRCISTEFPVCPFLDQIQKHIRALKAL